jgi:hypothetical protein
VRNGAGILLRATQSRNQVEALGRAGDSSGAGVLHFVQDDPSNQKQKQEQEQKQGQEQKQEQRAEARTRAKARTRAEARTRTKAKGNEFASLVSS